MAYQKKPEVHTCTGRTVKVEGNFEKALRTFSKKIQNTGLLKDLRSKEYFEKPAQAKQRIKKTAVKTERKRVTADRINPPHA